MDWEVFVTRFRLTLEAARLKLMTSMAVVWYFSLFILKADLSLKYLNLILLSATKSLGPNAFTAHSATLLRGFSDIQCQQVVADTQKFVAQQIKPRWEQFSQVPMVFSVLLLIVCGVWQLAGKTQSAQVPYPRLLAIVGLLGQMLPLAMIAWSQWQGHEFLLQPVAIDLKALTDSLGVSHFACLRRDNFPSLLGARIHYYMILASQLGLATCYLAACMSKLARHWQPAPRIALGVPLATAPAA